MRPRLYVYTGDGGEEQILCSGRQEKIFLLNSSFLLSIFYSGINFGAFMGNKKKTSKRKRKEKLRTM
jgi:hypothetical protein